MFTYALTERTTTRSHVSVSAQQLVELLRSAGVEIPEDAKTTVTIRLGMGGDLSGCNVDVSSDDAEDIVVAWDSAESITRHFPEKISVP